MSRYRLILTTFIAAALTAVPLWSYVTKRSISNTGAIVQAKWSADAFPIRWQMNPKTGPNVTGSRPQETVFQTSFATWQALTAAKLSFTEGAPTAETVKPGYDQTNLVTTNVAVSDYASGALGLTLVFSFNQGGVVDEFSRPVDFAGQIMEADIMFNPGVAFSTEALTPADKIDLQSVATHEIGHLLGLDHATILSATMFPTVVAGVMTPRVLSTDDMAGVSTLYPQASFSSKGTLSGTVRTTANNVVYGAIVTAVNANGQPVASAVTDPDGKYTIAGLDPGAYTVYAEPLDRPVTASDIKVLAEIYSGLSVFTNFTTRFR